MFFPLIYYVALPLLLAGLVIKFLRRYGDSAIPADVSALYERSPLERRWYRSVRRDGSGLQPLGDFETREDAVDAIYRARKDAQATGKQASFLVLNDKGEALEQIDC